MLAYAPQGKPCTPAALFIRTHLHSLRCVIELEARQGLLGGPGLDSGETKAQSWDDCRICPLINTRELWLKEKQMPDYDPAQHSCRCISTPLTMSCHTAIHG